jgi:cholesterol transport system auxiliary component
MRGRRSTATAGVLMCLCACTGGFKSDAPVAQTYVLRATPETVDPLPAAASLQVLRPLPHPGLESDRIMLLRSDRRLDHFNAVRWAAELPEVVEALVVDSLRGTGAFSSVHDSISGFGPQYLLRITIRRFEADYTARSGVPRVHVAFDCTLGRRSDREVLASFAAEGVADAEANRVNAVIAAFESAADSALDSMATQAVAALKTDRS